MVPLFDVSGVLMFKAARSIPGLMKGSLVSALFIDCRTCRNLTSTLSFLLCATLGSVES